MVTATKDIKEVRVSSSVLYMLKIYNKYDVNISKTYGDFSEGNKLRLINTIKQNNSIIVEVIKRKSEHPLSTDYTVSVCSIINATA